MRREECWAEYLRNVVAGSDTVRGPVDHSIVLGPGESCQGREDGTKCTKRCSDLSCHSLLARCYEVVTLSVISDISLLDD